VNRALFVWGLRPSVSWFIKSRMLSKDRTFRSESPNWRQNLSLMNEWALTVFFLNEFDGSRARFFPLLTLS
jgi:hypothetical protein